MSPIEKGFPGERFAVVSRQFTELMSDSPLTSDLYIHSLGHIAHAQYHNVERLQGCREYVFLYCTCGSGFVNIGDRELVLGANRYVVLPQGVAYSYRTDPVDPWTVYWVRFAGEKASVYARKMFPPATLTPSVHQRIEERTALFESMYSLLCGELSLDKLDLCNIILAHFLASFVFMELFRNEPSPRTGYAETMVSRVTHYMHENIEKNISLGELASYVGYSESYLYRKFVKETGFAPIEYFIRMKMDKASFYLIKTNLTVSEIAFKLGFHSPDYFSRTFKKIVGITASEFRKQGFKL